MATETYIKFARMGNAPDARSSDKPFFAAKPTPESAHRERSERRYTGRRNLCGSCHTAMSASGVCGWC